MVPYQVFVTPHTLCRGFQSPRATWRILNVPSYSIKLRCLIHESKEVIVAGTDAFESRMPSSDSDSQMPLSWKSCSTKETPLLTVDLDLYLEAAKKEPNSAVNFTYLTRDSD